MNLEQRVAQLEHEVSRLCRIISNEEGPREHTVALPNLRRVRKHRGLSVKGLSFAADVSEAVIYRAEGQAARITTRNAVQLARVLQVSLEHLRSLRPYVEAAE